MIKISYFNKLVVNDLENGKGVSMANSKKYEGVLLSAETVGSDGKED